MTAGSRRGAPRRPPWLAVAVVLALAGLAVWLGVRPRGERRPPAPAEVPSAALGESLQAAEIRGDWERALAHARRLAERDPRDPRVVLVLAIEWSNYASGGGAFERERPPVRTSLERARITRHVMALLDSAAALARTPEDRALVQRWRGQIYENAGLPLDALVIYVDAINRHGEDPATRARHAWVLALLQDPLADPVAPPAR